MPQMSTTRARWGTYAGANRGSGVEEAAGSDVSDLEKIAVQ